MANTGIRQLTTVVGGYAKRIWYSLNGTTPTNELMSIDDTGKLKCVSEQVTGLAGTGNRMVVADSAGNLSATTISRLAGTGNRMVVADSAGNLSAMTISRLPDGFDLNNLTWTINTGGWGLQNAPHTEFIFVENIIVETGTIKQKAYSSGVYAGSSKTRWERECVSGVWSAWRSGLADSTLAGTGSRMVVADSNGNLSATENFRVNTIPLINTSGGPNVALMSTYDISFHWVSNTSLRINMKGDDGVMRSTILTLS